MRARSRRIGKLAASRLAFELAAAARGQQIESAACFPQLRSIGQPVFSRAFRPSDRRRRQSVLDSPAKTRELALAFQACRWHRATSRDLSRNERLTPDLLRNAPGADSVGRQARTRFASIATSDVADLAALTTFQASSASSRSCDSTRSRSRPPRPVERVGRLRTNRSGYDARWEMRVRPARLGLRDCSQTAAGNLPDSVRFKSAALHFGPGFRPQKQPPTNRSVGGVAVRQHLRYVPRPEAGGDRPRRQPEPRTRKFV